MARDAAKSPTEYRTALHNPDIYMEKERERRKRQRGEGGKELRGREGERNLDGACKTKESVQADLQWLFLSDSLQRTFSAFTN